MKLSAVSLLTTLAVAVLATSAGALDHLPPGGKDAQEAQLPPGSNMDAEGATEEEDATWVSGWRQNSKAAC